MIDIDRIFEKYLKAVMKREAGQRTEAEWEDRMKVLYEEFGRTALPELGGKSPEEYFGGMTAEELAAALRGYVGAHLSVPDFLCDAVLAKPQIAPFLEGFLDEEDDELTAYAVNLLSDLGALPTEKYLELIESDACEERKDLAAEALADRAAEVREAVLARYGAASEEAKGYYLEILVAAGPDERTFALLRDAFLREEDNLPLFAAYFAKLGDERALPLLLRAIERPDLDYRDFRELKFAIEALGGEYETKRDFTRDAVYKKVREAGEKEGGGPFPAGKE